MTMTLTRNTIKWFDQSSLWNPRRNQACNSRGFAIADKCACGDDTRSRRSRITASRPFGSAKKKIIYICYGNDFDEEYT